MCEISEIICPFCHGQNKKCKSCEGIGRIRIRDSKGDLIKDLTPNKEEIDRFLRSKDYYEKYLPEIEMKIKKKLK